MKSKGKVVLLSLAAIVVVFVAVPECWMLLPARVELQGVSLSYTGLGENIHREESAYDYAKHDNYRFQMGGCTEFPGGDV